MKQERCFDGAPEFVLFRRGWGARSCGPFGGVSCRGSVVGTLPMSILGMRSLPSAGAAGAEKST